jgi:hypothetical protein
MLNNSKEHILNEFYKIIEEDKLFFEVEFTRSKVNDGVETTTSYDMIFNIC